MHRRLRNRCPALQPLKHSRRARAADVFKWEMPAMLARYVFFDTGREPWLALVVAVLGDLEYQGHEPGE